MGRVATVFKLLVLWAAVLMLVSSVGFSGAYFSDQSSSDAAQITVAELEPSDGALKFTPKSLSTTNQGITTIHLERPPDSTIDSETVVVTVGGDPVDAPVRTCNPQKCLFEPTAQDIVDAGGVGEPLLVVTAELENGAELEASTTIEVFEPRASSDGPDSSDWREVDSSAGSANDGTDGDRETTHADENASDDDSEESASVIADRPPQ
ncbi:hypothetical protein [Halostagnicola sp. A-GB9-2]|uniref:hypothetical protein n=1 Tax=Halostagnicola sp. A-GB9-2 TaxID=3048066 RepID=UPI0024C01078|nr:hypothetical protein [Halostagnicola sp. A-GB9-2]MDJ1433889.1 hypothetical protein [Halostagnicola sp. A-GB9-2]